MSVLKPSYTSNDRRGAIYIMISIVVTLSFVRIAHGYIGPFSVNFVENCVCIITATVLQSLIVVERDIYVGVPILLPLSPFKNENLPSSMEVQPIPLHPKPSL